jgi:hypothetical protein
MNIVNENYYKIKGNNNIIFGKENYINGNYNFSVSIHSFITGDKNVFFGENTNNKFIFDIDKKLENWNNDFITNLNYYAPQPPSSGKGEFGGVIEGEFGGVIEGGFIGDIVGDVY